MYYFIMNPTSRSSSKDNILDEIAEIAAEYRAEYQIIYTDYAGHAEVLAREISSKDPNAVIVPIGGDGSIHEIVNGLTNLETVSLGLIPRGSGNDFARGMGISGESKEAISTVFRSQRTVLMDIGILEYTGTRKRFAVSAGFGFDAAVCHEAITSPIKRVLNRLRLGQLTYSLIAVKNIFSYPKLTMSAETDDGRQLTFEKVFFTAIMNQKYEGGGCKMTPEARPDDGFFHVLVCSGVSRLALVAALPLAKIGLHTRIPSLTFLKCRSLKLNADRACEIHLDGEPCGIEPSISLGFEQQKLKVIVN